MSADLSTTYLGLKLTNPLVVSACPLTGNIDTIRELEAAGAAAAVLPSLFEEQIEHDEWQLHQMYEQQADLTAESQSFFPELDAYNTGPHTYLRHIEEAKKAVAIPIIGSLNGTSSGGWTRYGRLIQDAGADALELNIYFVASDPNLTSAEVERRYVDLVAEVRASVTIPIAVKIGPFFSALPNFARQLNEAGADGLVLFNRYLDPDVDIESLQTRPRLVLSNRHELWQVLRWIAILRDQVTVSLAATSGVHFADDVIKAIFVGADVVMMASSLIRYGAARLQQTRDEVASWLERAEYSSIAQLKGSMSLGNSADPGALQRANYMKALISFSDQYM